MIITSVLIMAVGGGGFFGGMQYQKSQISARGDGQFANRGAGNGAQRNGTTNGRPIQGEIISLDDKSITVKIQDGSSKIVILPDSVTVTKTDTATKADLKAGITVGVFGTSNSDGSVTAKNIQLNPMFRMGQNQPQSSASPK